MGSMWLSRSPGGKDLPSRNDGTQNLHGSDFFRGGRQRVPVQANEVGSFAHRERTQALLLAQDGRRTESLRKGVPVATVTPAMGVRNDSPSKFCGTSLICDTPFQCAILFHTHRRARVCHVSVSMSSTLAQVNQTRTPLRNPCRRISRIMKFPRLSRF